MSPEDVQAAAAVLLGDVATRLTLLETWGVDVRLKHDSVITSFGYVLRADDGFVSRSLAYLPFPDQGESEPV